MVDIKQSLLEKQPKLADMPGSDLLFKTLKTFFRENEINEFIETHQHLRGFAFLDKVLDHFNFTYQTSAHSLNNIPAEGRVIIIANHPIGSLDGLALLKLVHTVRADVKIVANEVLTQIEPLKSLFLPVEVLSGKAAYRSQLKAMQAALDAEQALIIFPAGEVSRIRPQGVRDGSWKTGFIKLARKAQAPILPIFINAKNSAMFYSVSTLYKPLGTALLVHEMFNKGDKQLKFYVGKAIPCSEFSDVDISNKILAKRFRKQLYRLAKKNKKPLFNTIETIAHPARRKALKDALFQSELLGETNDGKKIFLYDYAPDSPVIHEIGRLRELTFRSVEEGTGNATDFDKYDSYYRHLVLWDEDDLEIVGAYRIGECAAIIDTHGIQGLYTSTLFDLKPALVEKLPHAIELGRSFVQPRYWDKRSLDYLWFGIGAYLRKHPNIHYMFGPLSLSQAYSTESKEIILAFYQHKFGAHTEMAVSKTPFILPETVQQQAASDYADNYKESYKQLNKKLKHLGVKVPALYKQYTEICEEGGCQFMAFNIDPDFNYCIDSLILVEIDKIKDKRKQRYIGSETDASQTNTHKASDDPQLKQIA